MKLPKVSYKSKFLALVLAWFIYFTWLGPWLISSSSDFGVVMGMVAAALVLYLTYATAKSYFSQPDTETKTP